MNIKLSKFVLDAECPNDCDMCDDDMNGVYYGFIKINKYKIKTSLCSGCLKKLNDSFVREGVTK